MSNFETDVNGATPRNKNAEPRSSKMGKYQSKTAPKRRMRKTNKVTWILGVIAVLVLLIVFLFKGCVAGDELTGQWRIDEITAYRFDGNGHGTLILPDKTYAFAYEIQENYLSIDFESASARDFQYSFEVDGNQLTLTGGEGNKSVTYVLTKQKN